MSVDKLFSFGVISDVQHADIDNRLNHHKTRTRYYRVSIEHLKHAVSTWNESKVDFAVQLGDIIDGLSNRFGHQENDMKNLVNALKSFNSTGLPICKNSHGTFELFNETDNSGKEKVPYICNLWGNHEFYNFSRAALWKSALNSYIEDSNTDLSAAHSTIEHIDAKHGYYYSFVYRGYRFIALDSYDYATLSRPGATELYVQAMSFLKSKNKQKDLNEPPPEGAHFVQWNGGLTGSQLTWLHNELAKATASKEKVIIMSHVSFHPKAAHRTALCWNYGDVLKMINAFECTVACFAGHDHDGGFYHDREHNIYHVTFQGAVERPADRSAHAVVDVYEDRLEIKGYGDVPTRTLKVN